ncbi:MAG TPA: hypothetical protein VGO93_27990, partial [Candidatus Xenobia bacterium]
PNASQREQRFKDALAKLNLSADQKTKIDKIFADSSLQGRDRFKAIHDALTPEQQQQLQQLMPRGHHHGGGGTAPQQ